MSELDALIAALRAERETLDRRLTELELRVRRLEAPDWMTLPEAAVHLRTTTAALQSEL